MMIDTIWTIVGAIGVLMIGILIGYLISINEIKDFEEKYTKLIKSYEHLVRVVLKHIGREREELKNHAGTAAERKQRTD